MALAMGDTRRQRIKMPRTQALCRGAGYEMDYTGVVLTCQKNGLSVSPSVYRFMVYFIKQLNFS